MITEKDIFVGNMFENPNFLIGKIRITDIKEGLVYYVGALEEYVIHDNTIHTEGRGGIVRILNVNGWKSCANKIRLEIITKNLKRKKE